MNVRWVIMIAAGLSILLTGPAWGYPHDPPVDLFGDGPFGNDWLDYGDTEYAPIRVEVSPGQYENQPLEFWWVGISLLNPYHQLLHACDTAANRITHSHPASDYSDVGDELVAAGDCYFDWTYDEYVPDVTRNNNSHVTTKRNCISQAYHQYNSTLTYAAWWVDSADCGRYLCELWEIHWHDVDNTYSSVIVGDRCHMADRSHVWYVIAAGRCAKKIEWKNNFSAVYTWDHPTNEHNDAPIGKQPDGSGGTRLFDTDTGDVHYGIYNKNWR